MLRPNGKNLWQWWIQDALSTKPNYRTGKVDGFDLTFAMFMTVMVGILALMIGSAMLAAIIATKGVALVVFAVLGGAAYGVYKAIVVTASKGS